MAIKIGDAFIDLRMPIGSFNRNVAAANLSHSRMSSGIIARNQAMELSFQKVGAIIAAGVAVPIGVISTKTAILASQAAEADNVFSVAFGNMQKSAESFVVSISDATGLGRRAIRNAAGTFQFMAQSLGLTADQAFIASTSLVRLGVDLASFQNLKTEEAFGILRAAMSGSAEVMDRFGISMKAGTLQAIALNLGLKGPIATMSEQTKFQLRLIALTQASNKFEGDATKTKFGLARQTENLKTQFLDLSESIGKVFLPVFRGAAVVLGATVSSMASLSRAITSLGPVWLTVIGGLTLSFGAFAAAVSLASVAQVLNLKFTIILTAAQVAAKTVVAALAAVTAFAAKGFSFYAAGATFAAIATGKLAISIGVLKAALVGLLATLGPLAIAWAVIGVVIEKFLGDVDVDGGKAEGAVAAIGDELKKLQSTLNGGGRFFMLSTIERQVNAIAAAFIGLRASGFAGGVTSGPFGENGGLASTAATAGAAGLSGSTGRFGLNTSLPRYGGTGPLFPGASIFGPLLQEMSSLRRDVQNLVMR